MISNRFLIDWLFLWLLLLASSVLAWTNHPPTGRGKGLSYRSIATLSSTCRFTYNKDNNDDKNSNMNEKFNEKMTIPDEVDIVIIGAGLGGLCAGAILNTLYQKQVVVFESHYLAGGCAHAFQRKAKNGEIFTFDSGPTILLG